MKILIALLLMFSSAFFATGQLLIQPLDYNNTNATLTNGGIFFHEPSAGAGYEVPNGGGVHAIYSANFWFGAVDGSGNIFTTLGGDGNNLTDIDPGPFSTTNDYGDPSYDDFFMISLCQSEIDQFIDWWECSNGIPGPNCANVQQPTADVLGAIYEWPGNGNPALGQSQQLAPFFDKDGNGIYDPVGSGDYPIIKGCCATYIIQNDVGNNHSYSSTAPIGIEMHYLFYHFGANDLLYHSTFVDVMAINKGGVNYPSFAQGMYLDADLGFYGDDFFGSDSVNNMMYFYNGDNTDENQYGTNPPALGIVALESPITSAIPYQTGNVWNQMNGLTPSGAPFLDAGGSPTKFVYSGNPISSAEWNETTTGNMVGDRRGVMSTEIGAFNADDTIKQTYAILYSRVGNNLENAEHLSTLAQEVQAFYAVGDTDCDAGGIAGTSEMEMDEMLLFPNPASDFATIQFEGKFDYALFDSRGSLMLNDSGEGSNTFSVSDLAPGVYFVQLDGASTKTTKKLVID